MDVVERRLFLRCLERDLRATEHMGNLIWLPEKATFEEMVEWWRSYDPADRYVEEAPDEDTYFGGFDYHRQPSGGI